MEKLAQNKKVRQHAEKFMKTIESVVDHMEDLEGNDVAQSLIMLGARHATVTNMDMKHLPAFTKCVLLAWESVLGEEYTLDVQEAWTTVLEYIANKLSQGYYVYLEDKAEDSLDLKIAETSAFSVTNLTEVSTGVDT